MTDIDQIIDLGDYIFFLLLSIKRTCLYGYEKVRKKYRKSMIKKKKKNLQNIFEAEILLNIDFRRKCKETFFVDQIFYENCILSLSWQMGNYYLKLIITNFKWFN